MQFVNHHVHGPKQEIGHIDLLSKFSYIEVPEKDADKVMRALNGVRYKGREVRCNDADEGAPRSNASLKKKEYGRKKTDGRRNAGGRKDNGGAKGKDDWRALMKGGDVDFKDEEPDFSEEGWARRYPKKK